MKTRELIKSLRKFPKDAEVAIFNNAEKTYDFQFHLFGTCDQDQKWTVRIKAEAPKTYTTYMILDVDGIKKYQEEKMEKMEKMETPKNS